MKTWRQLCFLALVLLWLGNADLPVTAYAHGLMQGAMLCLAVTLLVIMDWAVFKRIIRREDWEREYWETIAILFMLTTIGCDFAGHLVKVACAGV
jgi:hypothetical protein